MKSAPITRGELKVRSRTQLLRRFRDKHFANLDYLIGTAVFQIFRETLFQQMLYSFQFSDVR